MNIPVVIPDKNGKIKYYLAMEPNGQLRNIRKDQYQTAVTNWFKIQQNILKRSMKLTKQNKQSHPLYRPEIWNNNPKVKDTHNCYAYAMNVVCLKLDNKPQPGYAINSPGLGDDGFTCHNIFQKVVRDNPEVFPVSPYQSCPTGYYKAFLVMASSRDNNKDYHFYRQDRDGMWSHKPGRGDVTDKDYSGKKIANPLIADRTSGGNKYSIPCTFFCVPSSNTGKKLYSESNREFQDNTTSYEVTNVTHDPAITYQSILTSIVLGEPRLKNVMIGLLKKYYVDTSVWKHNLQVKNLNQKNRPK